MEQLFKISSILTPNLTFLEFIVLISVFFFTSIISVVTGSTSLITVPAMMLFGIEPKSAVATNMLALVLMSAGGTLSFRGKNVIDRRRAPPLIALTFIGSIMGAFAIILVPSRILPVVVSVLMVIVVLFSLFSQGADTTPPEKQKTYCGTGSSGYTATFILSIYGGFFSGGYITFLTAAFVGFFNMTFTQAIATTKLVNIISSLSATIVFAYSGLVDYRLGIILGFVMFVGAFIGGRLALKLNNLWLQRIFLAAVIALALKIAFHDFLLKTLVGK